MCGVGITDASGNASVILDPPISEVGNAELVISGYNCLPQSFSLLITSTEDNDGDVIGLMRVLGDKFMVDLYDRGQTYEPPATIRTEINLDELPEGGYGLGIISQVMDDIHYERLPDDINHWQFGRQLPGQPSLP